MPLPYVTTPPTVDVQNNATGVSPSATGINCVLAVYTLPAGTLDQENRLVEISAQGSFPVNTDNLDLQIVFDPSSAVVGSAVVGGTVIAGQGGITDGAGQWLIKASVVKTGNPGSNTQLSFTDQPICFMGEFSVVGNSFGIAGVQSLTSTESSSILIAVTGKATNIATNIIWNFLKVEVR
jgi:hypothetical protein